MDSFRHQIQLPLNGSPFFSWPTGAQEPQHSGKRKLEPDANEVVERLNGFVLSPNTLKRLKKGQDEDVSMATSNIGSGLPQQQFEGGALEIEVDSSQPAEEVQRAFMVQLPSPSSPDGSPPRGTQNALILYPGAVLPSNGGCHFAAAGSGGNSDLMQDPATLASFQSLTIPSVYIAPMPFAALDLKGRGGAEASAPLDVPRRLVRNNSCSSLPRFCHFNLRGGQADADMEEDADPNSKAVIPWAPPPPVLQAVLAASKSGEEQPMEEEMEDGGVML